MSTKKEIRKTVRAALAAMSADEKSAEARQVSMLVLRHPAIKSARTVALFASLPDEIDTSTLLQTLSREARIVLPRINGDSMDFYPYAPEAMQRGFMGISEPEGLVPVAPAEIDVMILPGVAFTPDGGRLGRGKGYYDKYLSRSGFRACTIGICHSVQLLRSLPEEPHDKRLDEVIAASLTQPSTI